MSKKAKKVAKPVKKAKAAKSAAKPAKKAAKPAKKPLAAAAKKPAKAASKKEKLSEKPVKVLKALLKKVAPGKADAKAPKAAKGPAAKAPKAAKAVEPAAEPKLSKKELKAKAKAEAAQAEEAKAAIEKAPVKEVILTDAEGRILCRVKDCDQPAVVESYCRYHYLFFWKKIQNRKKILSEGKLEQYIEELTSRYPLKFLELIRKDLSSEPDFMSAIQELDIDEGNTDEEFEDENFIEEVRGISPTDTERVDDEY
jgi:hypothetical protein